MTHILSPRYLSFEFCQPEKENDIKFHGVVFGTTVISFRLNRVLELSHIGSNLTKTSKEHCGEIFIQTCLSVSQEITYMGLDQSKQERFPYGFDNI